uniref:Uncharacterized protein n=1 Tax=Ditylum brightwellii TaxID=49249 RepID=A0A7S4W3M2_9STRA|mmetsp:Transcript_7176/g.9193  ORF Transcript_7176/g.9193 Transcript_7176/m.9193 type:complete len:100 (+) Transcript_7176:158-457(+)
MDFLKAKQDHPNHQNDALPPKATVATVAPINGFNPPTFCSVSSKSSFSYVWLSTSVVSVLVFSDSSECEEESIGMLIDDGLANTDPAPAELLLNFCRLC